MNVKEQVEELKDYGIGLRRLFHKYPEFGGNEYKTSELITKELEKMGIIYKVVGATNVVGIIDSGKPGKTIGLRADIDGLPIKEESEIDYKSCHDGFMHACGHDGHIASLLTAAKVLSNNKEQMQGKVKLLFQSGEETGTGACELIKAGEIDDLDGIFGIHLWNEIEMGKVSADGGEKMASPIEFQIDIKGKGGHGSLPNRSIDATIPAVSLAMNLQTIVSMEMNPFSDVVLTIGSIYSGKNEYVEPGSVYNIISGTSHIEGTIRTFNDEEVELFKTKMERMVKGTETMFGVSASLIYLVHAPPVINDHRLAKMARDSCIKLFGTDSVDVNFGRTMAGEDFGYYRSKVPSMFVFVGSKNEKKLECFPHHHPRFNIDEDSIEIAAGLYTQFAVDFLKF